VYIAVVDSDVFYPRAIAFVQGHNALPANPNLRRRTAGYFDILYFPPRLIYKPDGSPFSIANVDDRPRTISIAREDDRVTFFPRTFWKQLAMPNTASFKKYAISWLKDVLIYFFNSPPCVFDGIP
jgi:hypothetical protein